MRPMRLSRARMLSIASVVGACGCERVPVTTPSMQPARPIVVPPLDAGPPADAGNHAHARGEVLAAFLDEEGGSWGPFYAIEPTPAELVKPCFGDALRLDPTLTGWAMFEYEPRGSGVRFAESSKLPKPLLECMERELRKMHIAEDFLSLPRSLVYVSLR